MSKREKAAVGKKAKEEKEAKKKKEGKEEEEEKEKEVASEEEAEEAKEAKETKETKETTARAAPAKAQAIAPMIDDEPQTPSKELAAIVGNQKLSLRQANQMVWQYVQSKGFQDKQDKRMIRIKLKPGEKEPLKDIVGDEPISMFDLSKKLREHLT